MRAGLAVAGAQVGVAEHALGPGEGVEGRDLDEQQRDHAVEHRLEVEVDVVGQDPVGHGLGAELGEVRRRAARRRADAHALEHRLGLVLGDRVLERDVAGGEPHLVVAGLVLEAGLVAGVGLEQALADVVGGGAGDAVVEAAAGRAWGSRRSMAPKPSTVPMRVSAEIVGSGAPLAMRNLDCSTFGKCSGQVSSGMSSGSVPNCSRAAPPTPRWPGPRNRVRGET